MPVDRTAAETFIWSAARLVDRHRYAMLFLGGSADPMLAALSGYRNPDGGFGHALEPDLRCPGSQPAATLSALEMLHEAGRLDSELARGARAWIASIAAADGGVPNALPGFEPYPHAPWWSSAPGSFLTFALAAVLHAGGDERRRVARPRHRVVLARGRSRRAARRLLAQVRLRVSRCRARRGPRGRRDRVADIAHRPGRARAGRRYRRRGASSPRSLTPAGQPQPLARE